MPCCGSAWYARPCAATPWSPCLTLKTVAMSITPPPLARLSSWSAALGVVKPIVPTGTDPTAPCAAQRRQLGELRGPAEVVEMVLRIGTYRGERILLVGLGSFPAAPTRVDEPVLDLDLPPHEMVEKLAAGALRKICGFLVCGVGVVEVLRREEPLLEHLHGLGWKLSRLRVAAGEAPSSLRDGVGLRVAHPNGSCAAVASRLRTCPSSIASRCLRCPRGARVVPERALTKQLSVRNRFPARPGPAAPQQRARHAATQDRRLCSPPPRDHRLVICTRARRSYTPETDLGGAVNEACGALVVQGCLPVGINFAAIPHIWEPSKNFGRP
eukprot:scaffold3499_cov247-Pinguiococcus_pyrenoidosus.AAC.8